MSTETRSESSVTAEIKRLLDALPECWYFKVHGSAMQKRGVPDLIICFRGRFVALELKRRDGGKESPLQAKRIRDIVRAGGIAGVACNADEALAILTEVNQLEE